MRNKQEGLEALAQSQSYDIIGIRETWWDESCDWCAVMDGYRLFRRDRQGTQGRGVVLYIREGWDCMALAVGVDMVESLWVRIKGKANKADVVVEVYSGRCETSQPARTMTPMNYSTRDISRSAALVLMGDFNFPDVSWEYHTGDTKRSMKFLQHITSWCRY